MKETYFPSAFIDALISGDFDHDLIVECIEADLDAGKIDVATSSDWVRMIRHWKAVGYRAALVYE